MSYQAKKDWNPYDQVKETDLNRWETGIEDAHIQLAHLSADVSNLKTRMNTLESTLPDGFTHNNFNDDLSTVNSIVVIRGYYNEVQSRLEV